MHRCLVAHRLAHFRHEPVHIGKVLVFRTLGIIHHHAEDCRRNRGLLAVFPYLLIAGIIAYKNICDVPCVHLCLIHLSPVHRINDGLEQVVTAALFRILEVKADDIKPEFLQKRCGVLIQFCLGIADNKALARQCHQTNGLQHQRPRLAGTGCTYGKRVGIVCDIMYLLLLPALRHTYHDAAFFQNTVGILSVSFPFFLAGRHIFFLLRLLFFVGILYCLVALIRFLYFCLLILLSRICFFFCFLIYWNKAAGKLSVLRLSCSFGIHLFTIL